MDPMFVKHFAAEWIAAWNSHELPRIMSHYTDDFSMASPKIVNIAGEPSGRLCGKEAIGAYWAKALRRVPDLHFELLEVLSGVDSIVLHYRGVGGRLVAEVFLFNSARKVYAAAANYA